MSWPAPDEFCEAIQNPQSCFADEGLCNGYTDCNALGLPIVSTGAFASVYRFRTSERDYAIRCFLHENLHRQERYRKIAHFVHNDSLQWTVDFDYLKEGIRVNSAWYPILKMEWVEGNSFSQYIEQNLHSSENLLSLADEFKRMVLGLKGAGVAHGDLQHGNIIMCGNELRLVDYDGMFVPALAGEYSHELGHPNYQHPKRSREHFGPYLDNFSSWIIFLGLHCISYDSTLWQLFNGGDEKLLLSRADFARPHTSIILSQLMSHRLPEIRTYGEVVLELVDMAPDRIPGLDEALNGACKPAFSRLLQRLSIRAQGAWQLIKQTGASWKPLIKSANDSPQEVERPDGWYQQPTIRRLPAFLLQEDAQWYQDWIQQPIRGLPEMLASIPARPGMIPTLEQWQRLSPREQIQLSLNTPDQVLLDAVRGKRDKTFVPAIRMCSNKALQDQTAAQLFCGVLVDLLVELNRVDRDTYLETVQGNLESLFVNSWKYCSKEMPDWLAQAYFRVLDFALRLTSTQIWNFNMLSYLRSWVLLPNAELKSVEEFLLVRIQDCSLSDDHRVRSIYAAKQLIQIYQSRLVSEMLIKEFADKVMTVLGSVSQSKDCSLFLLMTCQETHHALRVDHS